MTVEERGKLIGITVAHLRLMASTEKKAFSDGDTFLSLAFKGDGELLEIAKLCGAVKPYTSMGY